MAPPLSVRSLEVQFPAEGGPVKVVDGVSFEVGENEVFCLVGESGAGKTQTALAIMGLLPARARVSGDVAYRGRSMGAMTEEERRKLRGSKLAIVFQDALDALNPVLTVGDQIAEAATTHRRDLRGRELNGRVLDLLGLVGIQEPQIRARQYPHELSGGMRQRAVIAMALANDPDVLVADEPTSALDVTVQAQVLDVLKRVKERTRTAIVLITHDLGVVAAIADRVAVMYGGRLVESTDVDTLFHGPHHPYTKGLLASLPRLDGDHHDRLTGIEGHPPPPAARPPGCAFHPRCRLAALPEPCATEEPRLRPMPGAGAHVVACHRAEDTAPPVPAGDPVARPDRPPERGALLEVRDLVKHFPLRAGPLRRQGSVVHAVCGVSFDVARAETVCVVGESGCGKSTTARLVLNLVRATSGAVRFGGVDLLGTRGPEMRSLRRRIQIVFQDPYASLNPRVPVGRSIGLPLRVHGLWNDGGPERVADLMRLTGLDPADAGRYPHELSGGQRQRVGIARALATEPELVVLDEPVSALDVSVRAGVLNLLEDLQQRLGVAYLLISHDLTVVRHIADRVEVMYLGKVVESGPAGDLYRRPSHPYTQALLSAVPLPDPRLERARTPILLHGDLPDSAHPPSGCRFRTRCWKAADVCAVQEPALVDRGTGHPVACHLAEVSEPG